MIDNLKQTLLSIKSIDTKITKSLKLLVKLIDQKIENDNPILISAAFFHPYLKKKNQKYSTLVEGHIMNQLKDKKMVEYHDDYTKKHQDVVDKDSDDSDSADQIYGGNKRLKFDNDVDFSSVRNDNETVEEEFNRYKNSRLNTNDIDILFYGKVIIY